MANASWTNSSSNYPDSDPNGGADGGFDWPFVAVLVFVVAGTVGNVLVCLAVALERPLQNVTNWFLVSLAAADLLVSTVVMPFGATAGFLGYWPLNATWCNIYVTCDVLACSASILHMCCISLGRYLGIRSPLRARHSSGRYDSKRLVALRVVLVWLLALLISSPISALGLYDVSNIMIDKKCVINNDGFAFFGSLAAFYVPMIIMVVSYALTVQLLRKKAKLQQQRTVQQRRRNSTAGRHWVDADAVHQLTPQQQQQQFANNSRGTQTPVSVSRERRKLVWRAAFFGDPQVRVLRASEDATTPAGSDSATAAIGVGNGRRRRGAVAPPTPNISSAAAVANEQKASKVLGVVFFTFVLCWAPFFVVNAVMAVCDSCRAHIPDRLVALCLWLGYVSSCINPLIYTVFNRTFKRAFIQLLRCKCRRQAGGVHLVKRCSYSRCVSLYDGLSPMPTATAVSSNIAISTLNQSDGRTFSAAAGAPSASTPVFNSGEP